MNHLFISAARKSSGKTTISIGLCAALSERGLVVQAFKKGPDYIDPLWLGRASGRPCINLDFYTMRRAEIAQVFANHAADADISVIEGNKGLYDGLDLDGSNSNAALAKMLGAPVVLVLNARGMTRGIAPLILGYQGFDTDINIVGVILNDLGGLRHEEKLRAVIEHYTDVQVLGSVQRNQELVIGERHLGLIPSNEFAKADAQIAGISTVIGASVDLDAIIEVAGTAALPDTQDKRVESLSIRGATDVRIGIARDTAFGFYYADDLQALRDAGAELIFLDLVNDADLPGIDGLFIGGGFPEVAMEDLERNHSMRTAVHDAIEDGLPVYAECGGLMYLARSLQWQGRTCEMAGVIPGDVVMHASPQGRGYVQLEETGNSPWPPTGAVSAMISAHEFHHSSIENLDESIRFAYAVKRGHGIDGKHDGIVYKNLLANYAHLRDTSKYRWVSRFIDFVRLHKANDDTERK